MTLKDFSQAKGHVLICAQKDNCYVAVIYWVNRK